MLKIEKQEVHFSNRETKWYKVYVNGTQKGTISFEKGLGYSWSEMGGFFSKLSQCKKYIGERLIAHIYTTASEQEQQKILKGYTTK
jgi:hypothetical protein